MSDLLNTPNSKSKRRKGNPNPMKRKREMPKEPEELLKRGAALAHVAEALLKEQRASDSGRLVNKAEYGTSILIRFSSTHANMNLVTLPDLKTPEQFNAFGNQIIAQVDGLGTATGDFNLHPFLSFISSPWEERPNFHKRQDAAKNPIRSPWRKTYPSAAQKDADKKANGGVDRPILQYRHEALDADKYGVVRDVTFLPNPVPLATPSWKLALYTTLGATPDDIAHRVSTTDPDLNDRVVSHQQLRNNIKKKVDDWSKLYHGGFQWLGDRQKSRARKDNSEEPEQESRKGKGKSKARQRKSRARKASGEAQEQKSRKGKDDGEAKDGNGAKEGSEAKEKELGHEFARTVLAGWGDRRQAVSDLGYYFVGEPSPSCINTLTLCRIQPGRWTSSSVSCGNQTQQGLLIPCGRLESARKSRRYFSNGGRKSPSCLNCPTCRTWSTTMQQRFYSRMETSRLSRVYLEWRLAWRMSKPSLYQRLVWRKTHCQRTIGRWMAPLMAQEVHLRSLRSTRCRALRTSSLKRGKDASCRTSSCWEIPDINHTEPYELPD